MGVSPETKVGIFTASALLVLFSLFFWLNRVSFLQKGSEIDIVFERIDGLRPGAPVKYVGVDVGRISSIFFEGNHIIVRVHINQGFTVPLASKAFIASAGVVGDKFLDLHPLKAGEAPRSDNRIQGQTPATLDQFYVSAYEVMQSVKQTVDSINSLVADPALANSIRNSLANIEKLTNAAHQLIAANEVTLNSLVENATRASNELAQAGATANHLLREIEANGQTAGQIRDILTHINSISANLDKFSGILADKGPQIDVMAEDVHQTMNSINAAAQSVTKALNSVSSDGSGNPNLKQTIDQAAAAAQKVGAFVKNFEKVSLINQAGVNYHSSENVAANYQIDLNLNEQKAFRVSLEDIGHDNLATFQYNLKYPRVAARVGIYRNQVGIGLDLKTPFNHTLGIDLWDTREPYLGLTSKWQVNNSWSLALGAYSSLEEPDTLWNAGWWYKF